jgi:hypothetical protein
MIVVLEYHKNWYCGKIFEQWHYQWKVDRKTVLSATLGIWEQRTGDTAQFTTTLCNATRQGQKTTQQDCKWFNKGRCVLLLEDYDWCTPPQLQPNTATLPPSRSQEKAWRHHSTANITHHCSSDELDTRSLNPETAVQSSWTQQEDLN